MTTQTGRSICSLTRALLIAVFLLAGALNAADASSVTYEHDAKGRVTKATYDNGNVVDYTYDANGNRTKSEVTVAPPDTIPPSAPGVPSFSNITMTSATASWAAASDNRSVVGYEYKVNAGNWLSLPKVLSVSLSGLSAATSYTVQVRARDAASNLGPASSGAFTTPDTEPPSVPTGLSASAPNSTTVNVSWAASTDNVGVTGYRVYRNGSQITTRTTTSYTDAAVTGSTSYSYAVSAYDAAGNTSALSSAVGVTTPDTIAPSTPTSLSASAVSPSRINLSWGGSSDTGGSGLAGYRVYRGGAHIATTGATSYSDTGLAGATAYAYTVAAYDNASNVSGQSNTASATTWPVVQASVSAATWNWLQRPGKAPQLDPPVVVTASGGSGSGYTYAWQFVSGDTQTSAISPTSNSTRWTRTIPNQNAEYVSTWRCLVTDSAGNTAYSANVQVTFTKITNQ